MRLPKITEIKPKYYIVDGSGKRLSVVLDINVFERLLKERESLYRQAKAQTNILSGKKDL